MHGTIKLGGGGWRAHLAKNQVVGTDHQKVALYLLIYLLFHPRMNKYIRSGILINRFKTTNCLFTSHAQNMIRFRRERGV
jgi:hypothetical protein